LLSLLELVGTAILPLLLLPLSVDYTANPSAERITVLPDLILEDKLDELEK
jgi:hypothetical protein